MSREGVPMDNTKRFSDRVQEYRAYRPGYPAGAMDILRKEAGLGPGSVAADIGSGTGIFTRLLLEQAASVYAVEPNAEMRKAAEADLSSYPGFKSLDAPAEATGIPAKSVDLITAAQAFHWFDPEKCKAEFARILKDGGSCALIWNDRKTDPGGFHEAYENLLDANIEAYRKQKMKAVFADVEIERFFSPGRVRYFELENSQSLDFQGLKGRLLSSSYAPKEGQENHEQVMEDLADLFGTYAEHGILNLEYRTRIYLGAISGNPRI